MLNTHHTLEVYVSLESEYAGEDSHFADVCYYDGNKDEFIELQNLLERL